MDTETTEQGLTKSSALDDTTARHQNFQVLIGVAGQTGAGKTSLLNALLGVYELLPSGHEQAATAVSCKIAWNYDMTPGRETRAEIFFQTAEEIRDQIVQTLKAFRLHRETEMADYAREDERLNDLAEHAFDIKNGMDKIYAVWRATNNEVKAMAMACDTPSSYDEAAEKILSRNETVIELLKVGTKEFASSEAESLGKLIKPYLDSTTDSHGHHNGEFAAWPLIKNVNIFLRSEILRTGICLVDLPGVGDNVESRVRVAEEYRRKLEVTIIVAAIHRATDEKATQKLLNDSEEMRMRISQGYNRRSFGVVLSKMDDLDWEGYIKRSKEAAKHSVVQEHLGNRTKAQAETKSLKTEKKAIDKVVRKRQAELKKVEKKTQTTESKRQEGSIQDEIDQSINRSEELQDLIAAAEQTIKLTDLQLQHWAINKRNESVQLRLQDDHERRQREFACEGNDDEAEPHITELDIMSTSTRAFWKLRTAKKGTTAFPTAEYTGIPGVIQWMHLAATPARERHLDVVLQTYRNALDGMEQWCKTENIDLNIQVNLDAVTSELDGEYKRFKTVSLP